MKRWLALLLAVLLVLATAGVAFADDSAADDTEPIAEAKVISFDTKSAGWDGFNYVFNYVGFHIWNVSGDSEFKHHDWGAKKERGTDADGDGIWTFDFDKSGLTLRDDAQYAVVFYNNKGGQTYNLLFDTACCGDTAFCDLSIVYENPEDSSKKAAPAYWAHQDPAVNGPQLCVTSIGNVQGSCVPRGMTRVDLFNSFLDNTLENARTFSGLSDQELLDNLGAGLEFDAETVRDALAASGHEAEWSYEASTLAKYNLEPTEPEPIDGGYKEYPVNVEVAAGNGTAVSDKDTVSIGIGVAPEHMYDTITLTATPYKDTLPGGENGETFYSPYDYLFFGWDIYGDYTIENGGSLGDEVVTLKVTGGITAYAYFVPVTPVPGDDEYFTVDADAYGNGTAKASRRIVSFNGSVAPPHIYPTVTLTATPQKGYFFEGWEIQGPYEIVGDGDLTSPVLTVEVHDSIKAHAGFCIAMPVEPGYKLGDADDDGKVTIIDATRIQRYMAKLIPESQINLAVSDTDGDTKVTILDATRIQRVLAGLCDWEGNPVDIPEPTTGEYEGPIAS